MNERYLFRGRRTDNDKWEIGLLARYNPMYPCANIIISPISWEYPKR